LEEVPLVSVAVGKPTGHTQTIFSLTILQQSNKMVDARNGRADQRNHKIYNSQRLKLHSRAQPYKMLARCGDESNGGAPTFVESCQEKRAAEANAHRLGAAPEQE
jgi:hypothetical protein